MLINCCNFGRLAQAWRHILGLALIAGLLCSSSAIAQRMQPPNKLSATQQVTKADTYLKEMKTVLKRAFGILAEAREQQDIQKLNNINEALSAIKGLLKLSEQNFVMLQEAVAKKDARSAEHEFVKISIAYSKIIELDGRIRSLGRPSSGGTVDGRPIIERIVDVDLPIEDPLEGLKDISVDVQRPPSSSPFF